MEGSEVTCLSLKNGLGWALDALSPGAYGSPSSEADPSFCSQQMSCSGRLAPGKGERQGPRHWAGKAGLDLLFHSTDACLVLCLVLIARDTGVNGTAKTPPTLPRHTLATFPGPFWVFLSRYSQRERTSSR